MCPSSLNSAADSRAQWGACWRAFAQSEPLTAAAHRPLQRVLAAVIKAQFERALTAADGAVGTHCIHELWMRRDLALNIDKALERLWMRAAKTIPDWLPMRDIDLLALAD